MNKADYSRMRGNPGQTFIGIEEQVAQFGPWYLLLRAHDHIWNDKDWPLEVRWEASHFLWTHANQVPPGKGMHYCETSKATVLYPKSECGCAIGLREE
jgi:hypothetical protein